MNRAVIEANVINASSDVPNAQIATSVPLSCFHCGSVCPDSAHIADQKTFCCSGCKTVFQLLHENGLQEFYHLSEHAGARASEQPKHDQFAYLDDAAIRERLINFSDKTITRVTFRIPAIHCIACVWLLENLFRLNAGIGESHVNFPQKLVTITFQTADVKLSELVALLTSLGYGPDLKLSDLDSKPKFQVTRRLWIQLGLAGFAFGNIMLFSISAYLGLDAFAGPIFRRMVASISFLLSLPVISYSALDYWRAAHTSLKQRLLNIDVPIAAGLAAIFIQSCHEIASGKGEGYFDSLCGLIFFLLCGRLFQQKTYHRLTFDRDYKSFFPLSITRKKNDGNAEQTSLAQLQIGDRLLIRNGELIPADAIHISGNAAIDYSFVTGESELVAKASGDRLYAGGRQSGSAIEVEIVKAVSQSYLTSLWDQEAFRKRNDHDLNALTNKYSQRFTKLVLSIAIGAGVFWAFSDLPLAIKAFTSVLIVACPCALALAAPFTLGTAQRLLTRRGIYLKNPFVLEKLAKIDTIVFDKTGTLTAPQAAHISWSGLPLTKEEKRWIRSLAGQSTHPLSVQIGNSLNAEQSTDPVRSFQETTGCGIEGSVSGHHLLLGSSAWIAGRVVNAREVAETMQVTTTGSAVHLAINGKYRGCFSVITQLKPETPQLIDALRDNFQLALLTGDNEKERQRFAQIFHAPSLLCFNQSPLDKLNFIRRLQENGGTIMMVGDGLNDAGALKQSNVGMTIVENISAFSPASDIILEAKALPQLPSLLKFARQAARIVRSAFLISAAYNLVGIAIAASGKLSPLVCAILMPLSSASVVLFGSLATTLHARSVTHCKEDSAYSKNAKRMATDGEYRDRHHASLFTNEQGA